MRLQYPFLLLGHQPHFVLLLSYSVRCPSRVQLPFQILSGNEAPLSTFVF